MKSPAFLASAVWLNCPWIVVAADPAARVFEQITPSVVEIAGLESWGSGVLVSADGMVITNRHVVGDLPVAFIRASGQPRPGAEAEIRNFHEVRVAGEHPERDLILLQVDAPGWLFQAVDMASDVPIRAGVACHAIGTPTGSRVGTATTHSITSGIVSATRVDLPGGPFIQTTTPVNPGNSGGPLCDSEGRVIGVVTARLEGAQSISLAIPWAAVRREDFKAPEPLNLPTFEALEETARQATAMAAESAGRQRLLYLRDELTARRAQLAHPNPPMEVFDRLAELFIELDDTATAARVVAVAQAIDPDRALTGFWNGHIAWSEGRRGDALDLWLEVVIRHDPPTDASARAVSRCLVGCGIALRAQHRLAAAWYAFHSAAAVDGSARQMNAWPADFDQLARDAVVEWPDAAALAVAGGIFSFERLQELMRLLPSTENEDRFAAGLENAEKPRAAQATAYPIDLPANAGNLRLQNPPPGLALDADARVLRVAPEHPLPDRVMILYELDGVTRYLTFDIP